MQSFHSIRQLKNGKNYDTAITIKMSEGSSTESSPLKNALERNVKDEHELCVLTSEEDQTTRGIDSADSGDDDRSTSYLLLQGRYQLVLAQLGIRLINTFGTLAWSLLTARWPICVPLRHSEKFTCLHS